jgi:hypothetical protein
MASMPMSPPTKVSRLESGLHNRPDSLCSALVYVILVPNLNTFNSDQTHSKFFPSKCESEVLRSDIWDCQVTWIMKDGFQFYVFTVFKKGKPQKMKSTVDLSWQNVNSTLLDSDGFQFYVFSMFTREAILRKLKARSIFHDKFWIQL